jgi:hypothetical protein
MGKQIGVYVVVFTDQNGAFHWWAVKAFSYAQAAKIVKESPENINWKVVGVNHVDVFGIGTFLKT